MNEQAQACLRKAAECKHTALQVRDEQTRLMYLDLANQWRTMAEQAEAMDRERARFEQSEPNSESN